MAESESAKLARPGRDLLEGKQIIVKGKIEWNGIYTAAKRQRVQARRVQISDSQFAVAAAGRWNQKIGFIRSGNTYFAREKELPALSRAADKAGASLDRQVHLQLRRWKVFKVALL